MSWDEHFGSMSRWISAFCLVQYRLHHRYHLLGVVSVWHQKNSRMRDGQPCVLLPFFCKGKRPLRWAESLSWTWRQVLRIHKERNVRTYCVAVRYWLEKNSTESTMTWLGKWMKIFWGSQSPVKHFNRVQRLLPDHGSVLNLLYVEFVFKGSLMKVSKTLSVKAFDCCAAPASLTPCKTWGSW